MAGLNHLTSYLPQFQPSPSGSIKLNKVHSLMENSYLKMDEMSLSFDLNANLTSEFHWNMNQLFVYIVASYNSTSNVRNEVTIWDDIVTSVDEAYKVGEQMVEYNLRDQFKEFLDRNIRLHVRYRTMPITGIMYTKEIATFDFESGSKRFRDPNSGGKAKKTRGR